MIWISGSLNWSKALMEMIFNTCGEFRWNPEGPVSQIRSPHLHDCALGIFQNILRSVQMINGEWGAESNGKLTHLLTPSKTATLVPEFAVEDMPLDTRRIWNDDYDVQMIFGDLVGLKLPGIYIAGEEKPRKILIQKTCPGRGSNPGPLLDRLAYYRLLNSRWLLFSINFNIGIQTKRETIPETGL